MEKLIISSLNNAKTLETVGYMMIHGHKAYGNMPWWPTARKIAAGVIRRIRGVK